MVGSVLNFFDFSVVFAFLAPNAEIRKIVLFFFYLKASHTSTRTARQRADGRRG
jgi:hypothetical protein